MGRVRAGLAGNRAKPKGFGSTHRLKGEKVRGVEGLLDGSRAKRLSFQNVSDASKGDPHDVTVPKHRIFWEEKHDV